MRTPRRAFRWVVPIVIALLMAATPASGQYQMESSVAATGFIYYYDFDVDAAGNAHVAYEDTQIDRLYYCHDVSGSWSTPEFIHTCSDIGSTAVSAAIDASGIMHIAYDSGMGGNDVFTYATNAGGSWASSVVRTTSRWYSLDLSPLGEPRVAYLYDYSGLNYAALSGGVWSHTIADPSGSITRYAGRYPDLAVDADGHGHIVYYNFDTDSIRYATDSSGSWQWEELVIGPGSRYAEITLEPDGTIIAGYLEDGRIWIARNEAGTWNPLPVTDAGSYGYIDLQTDSAGNAYVVYEDNSADKLMLAAESGGSFAHFEIYEPADGGAGPALRIRNDRVHVLTWDRVAEELVHLEGPLPSSGKPGDLNCDGAFNGADIDPFFLALGDPAAYALAFPDCDINLGDMNGDGAVNGGDIDPFFECLGGGVCP